MGLASPEARELYNETPATPQDFFKTVLCGDRWKSI
jgi:hypothetical protein